MRCGGSAELERRDVGCGGDETVGVAMIRLLLLLLLLVAGCATNHPVPACQPVPTPNEIFDFCYRKSCVECDPNQPSFEAISRIQRLNEMGTNADTLAASVREANSRTARMQPSDDTNLTITPQTPSIDTDTQVEAETGLDLVEPYFSTNTALRFTRETLKADCLAHGWEWTNQGCFEPKDQRDQLDYFDLDRWPRWLWWVGVGAFMGGLIWFAGYGWGWWG